MPNRELLIRGAEALEADARNSKGVRFDLEFWGMPFDSDTNESTPADTKNDIEQLKVDCGTAACAMGFFCVAKTFEKEGLGFEAVAEGGGYQINPVLMATRAVDGVTHRREGFGAAEQLFDITFTEAMHLFQANYYREAKGAEAELAVARRMRQVAAGEDYKNDPCWD